MDGKQKDLSPDLKQVYDRVMSTQVKPQGAPAPSAAPTTNPTPPPPPAASPTPPPGQVTPPPIPGAPNTPPNIPPPGANPATAKPATDGGFVFSGNKMKTAPTIAGISTPNAGGKKISPAIILGAVVVGIVVWGVAWAKIFGLI